MSKKEIRELEIQVKTTGVEESERKLKRIETATREQKKALATLKGKSKGLAKEIESISSAKFSKADFSRKIRESARVNRLIAKGEETQTKASIRRIKTIEKAQNASMLRMRKGSIDNYTSMINSPKQEAIKLTRRRGRFTDTLRGMTPSTRDMVATEIWDKRIRSGVRRAKEESERVTLGDALRAAQSRATGSEIYKAKKAKAIKRAREVGEKFLGKGPGGINQHTSMFRTSKPTPAMIEAERAHDAKQSDFRTAYKNKTTSKDVADRIRANVEKSRADRLASRKQSYGYTSGERIGSLGKNIKGNSYIDEAYKLNKEKDKYLKDWSEAIKQNAKIDSESIKLKEKARKDNFKSKFRLVKNRFNQGYQEPEGATKLVKKREKEYEDWVASELKKEEDAEKKFQKWYEKELIKEENEKKKRVRSKLKRVKDRFNQGHQEPKGATKLVEKREKDALSKSKTEKANKAKEDRERYERGKFQRDSYFARAKNSMDRYKQREKDRMSRFANMQKSKGAVLSGASEIRNQTGSIFQAISQTVGELTMFAGAIMMVGMMAGRAVGTFAAIGDAFGQIEKQFLTASAFRNSIFKTHGIKGMSDFDNANRTNMKYTGLDMFSSGQMMARIGDQIRQNGSDVSGSQLEKIATILAGAGALTGKTSEESVSDVMSAIFEGKKGDKIGLAEYKATKNIDSNIEQLLKLYKSNPISSAILKTGTVESSIAKIRNSPKNLLGRIYGDSKAQIGGAFGAMGDNFMEASGREDVVFAWRRALTNMTDIIETEFTTDKIAEALKGLSVWAGMLAEGAGKLIRTAQWFLSNGPQVIKTLKDFVDLFVTFAAIKIGFSFFGLLGGIGKLITGLGMLQSVITGTVTTLGALGGLGVAGSRIAGGGIAASLVAKGGFAAGAGGLLAAVAPALPWILGAAAVSGVGYLGYKGIKTYLNAKNIGKNKPSDAPISDILQAPVSPEEILANKKEALQTNFAAQYNNPNRTTILVDGNVSLGQEVVHREYLVSEFNNY